MGKAILIFVLLAFAYCGKIPVRMVGSSMRPTLNDGDQMLMDNSIDSVGRGDIVWFKYPKDETKYYVKRIVGLPGESIRIDKGVVFINGVKLDEPYIDPEFNTTATSTPETIVPADSYFVLGDNRDNSSDSRSWGTVRRRLIKGKYRLTYANNSK